MRDLHTWTFPLSTSLRETAVEKRNYFRFVLLSREGGVAWIILAFIISREQQLLFVRSVSDNTGSHYKLFKLEDLLVKYSCRTANGIELSAWFRSLHIKVELVSKGGWKMAARRRQCRSRPWITHSRVEVLPRLTPMNRQKPPCEWWSTSPSRKSYGHGLLRRKDQVKKTWFIQTRI